MDEPQAHIYEFGDFRVDAVKRLLLRHDGGQIPLTPKVFDTLLYLVRHNGKVIEKDELMREIWADTIVEENNLSQNISILRRILGEKRGEHRFIVTIPGKGFKFVSEVSEKQVTKEIPIQPQSAKSKIFAQPRFNVERKGNVLALADWQTEPEGESSAATADARHTTSSAEYLIGEIKSRKRSFAVGLMVLLLASIGLGYWFFANRSLTANAIESIAVLPFENASNDANLDYLSDGLSESLIDRLAQLPQMKVIARNSSFKYRGNADLSEAANALGVQAIVTGRVVQRGDSLIIRVEMIDARNNRQLWSDNFTRNLSDVQKLQTDISREIAENLRLRLSGTQTRQLAKQETTNPQAYELLLKGRFYALKIGKEDQKKGIEYYEQAIAVDPNYALAYAKLSGAYAIFAGNSLGDPKEFIPKAQAAARKALELDENLADAHLARACLYQMAWDWAAAEAAYKRAIELNPNLADARRIYAFYLGVIGRHDESIIEVKRARELDPMSLINSFSVANAFLFARRFDEAIAESEKLLELNENYRGAYYTLGFCYAAKGMYKEAIANYQEAMRRGGNSISGQIYLGAAFARSGEREKALEILKQLETSKEYVSPGELPVLYVALGERKKAFASLEKAYAAHDSQLQFLKVESNFDSLRDDPRFQDLLRRVGLPQ